MIDNFALGLSHGLLLLTAWLLLRRDDLDREDAKPSMKRGRTEVKTSRWGRPRA
ncbi:hypothetical protein [Stakelama marina]|uniref:Uncharacterized protein n=1 Tax=Stakelama marina TaxID=2826939 RepID=A0A8T4IGS5_9SPHN|nr:hypothetical protein [Stakelama marina]MBR0553797.1 hypothetical protein [Stakelama marina]